MLSLSLVSGVWVLMCFYMCISPCLTTWQFHPTTSCAETSLRLTAQSRQSHWPAPTPGPHLCHTSIRTLARAPIITQRRQGGPIWDQGSRSPSTEWLFRNWKSSRKESNAGVVRFLNYFLTMAVVHHLCQRVFFLPAPPALFTRPSC